MLDLQAAQGPSRSRGIGRYSLSLAQSIVRHRGEHEIIIALGDLNPATIEPLRGVFDGLLPQENIRIWQAAGPVAAHQRANGWRRSVAQHLRDSFLASLRPDVIHVSSMLEGRHGEVVTGIGALTAPIVTTATLYDLIPLLNTETYFAQNPAFERHYREMVAHLARADGWLAISESAAREAQAALGLDPEYVVNVSAASDSIFRRMAISPESEDAMRRRFGLTKPFVMYSGGADDRKNLHRLVRAYALLPLGLRSSHQLALVGPMPELELSKRTARTAGLAAGEVVFTGFVDDADLVQLYNLCQLFVLPSTHEGFGLPALEAMACGAPVIGSHTTSIPEVIGWHEALFDPFDPAAIAAKIKQGLTDGGFRTELIHRGGERARAFSWDETGKRAIAALERIHGARNRGKSSVNRAPHIEQLIDEIARSAVGVPSEQDLLRTAKAIARNHAASGKQLLVDVSQLVHVDTKTDVQRVVGNLLDSLPKVIPPPYRVEPVYATLNRPGYRYASRIIGDPRRGGHSDDPAIEINPGDLFLGLDPSFSEVIAQTGFLAELRRLGVLVRFVVYDMLPILMPKKFPSAARDRHERWLSVLATCDGALCISRSVADELSSWLESNRPQRHRPFRISWFHLGVDHKPTAAIAGSVSDHVPEGIAGRRTFLVVGTVDPRNGHAQALAAFDELWSGGSDVNLVFVGRQGSHVEEFVTKISRHAEINRRLFWLEGVDDQDVANLYATSSCLLMVSEGEGFGLPLIEAAQYGTPILARDIALFREIAGDHAMYFNGFEPSDLVRAVRRWQRLWAQGGLPNSQDIRCLSWQESAAQVVDVLLNRRDYRSLMPTPKSVP